MAEGKAQSSDDILKEGVLGFSKQVVDPKFKDKYIKLSRTQIMVLSGPKDTSAKDVIDLKDTIIGNSSAKQFCFAVNQMPNTFLFASNTKEDFDVWHKLVTETVEKLGGPDPIEPSKPADDKVVESPNPGRKPTLESESSSSTNNQSPENNVAQGPPKKKLPIGAVAMPGFGPAPAMKMAKQPPKDTSASSAPPPNTSTEESKPPNKAPPPVPQKSNTPLKDSGTPPVKPSNTAKSLPANPNGATSPPPQKQTASPMKNTGNPPVKAQPLTPAKSSPSLPVQKEPVKETPKQEPAPVKETAKPSRPARDAVPTNNSSDSFISSSSNSGTDYSPQISALEARMNEIAKKLDKEYALRSALETQVKNLEHRLNEEIEERKRLEERLSSSAPGQKKPLKVKATFSYEAQDGDELGFNEGDIIEVTKDDPSGWWEGTINGKSGMFPAGFVTVIEYAS